MAFISEYINIHKIVFIFYHLRLNMFFDLLDENIINFDLIIDLLVHKQTIIQENIIDLYKKTIDLLNCNSDNLSKTYIKICNDLLWYNFNNIYYKRCIKQLFFL